MSSGQDKAEVGAFLVGLIVFNIGCGFQWGWPAALIALGGIFAFWPLVKQFRQ